MSGDPNRPVSLLDNTPAVSESDSQQKESRFTRLLHDQSSPPSAVRSAPSHWQKESESAQPMPHDYRRARTTEGSAMGTNGCCLSSSRSVSRDTRDTSRPNTPCDPGRIQLQKPTPSRPSPFGKWEGLRLGDQGQAVFPVIQSPRGASSTGFGRCRLPSKSTPSLFRPVLAEKLQKSP